MASLLRLALGHFSVPPSRERDVDSDLKHPDPGREGVAVRRAHRVENRDRANVEEHRLLDPGVLRDAEFRVAERHDACAQIEQ